MGPLCWSTKRKRNAPSQRRPSWQRRPSLGFARTQHSPGRPFFPLGFWQDSGSKLPTFDQPQLDMPHATEIQPNHITYHIQVHPFKSICIYICGLINWTNGKSSPVPHYLHEMILSWRYIPTLLRQTRGWPFAHHPEFLSGDLTVRSLYVLPCDQPMNFHRNINFGGLNSPCNGCKQFIAIYNLDCTWLNH